MKILITGFDPFGNESTNPSYEAVKRLPDKVLNCHIIKAQVPTVAYKSIDTVIELIKIHQPDVVVNVGQAGGREHITPEKVAINYNNFSIPDNDGNQLVNTPIYDNASDAYFTTLPINSIVVDLEKKNIPAKISYTAGTFVCNHLMYGILHYIKINELNIKSGFIHIPFMDEQVIDKPGQSSMSLNRLIISLESIINSIIENNADIDIISGNIC